MVRQRADALMLSGESAIGAYPEKALGVLRQVSTRIEEWVRCCLPTTAPLSSLHKHTFLARMLALACTSAYRRARARACTHTRTRTEGARPVRTTAHRQEKYGEIVLPTIAKGLDGRVSEELCASAVGMANALDASAIFVYTRRGYMANFLSRCRPDAPIFAFTGATVIRCGPAAFCDQDLRPSVSPLG